MKETELKNTSETSEMEVQNLSGQDKASENSKSSHFLYCNDRIAGCIIFCGSEYRKPESQLPGTTERIICKVQ